MHIVHTILWRSSSSVVILLGAYIILYTLYYIYYINYIIYYILLYYMLHYIILYHHQRSFTANSGTKAAVPPKVRSSTANSATKVAVVLGMNRCSNFLLLSAPHSLFSIWTDLKRSEKIPGTPAWSWGEWIWLTGPSGLHRNSPQGLNVSSIRVFDQIRDPEIPITLRPHYNIII